MPRSVSQKRRIPNEILNEFCRFCLLPSKKLYSVHEVSLTERIPNKQTFPIKISDVIKMLWEIKIKLDDRKPQNICLICVNSIKDCYQFFETFKENDLILGKISSNKTSNEEFNHLVCNILQEHENKERIKAYCIHYKNKILDQCDDKKTTEHDFTVKDEENKQSVPSDLVNNVQNIEKYPLDHISKLAENEDNNDIDDYIKHQEWKDSSDDDCFLADLKKEIDSSNNKKTKTRCHRYQGKKVKTKFKDGERFVCQFCMEQFSDIHSTIAHFEDSHPNESQCLICLKIINMFMKVHISNHAEVSTSCRSCRIYFGKQELLEEHFQKFDHTSTRCHLCNKKFLTKSKRNFHLKVVHYNSVKPFCCEVCGKQFRYLPNMERHKRTHVIAKRFMCSQCGEKYSTNNALRRHILRVHEGKVIDKKTKEKVPYVPKPTGRRKRGDRGNGKCLTIKCDYCDSVLTSKNGYARHLETHPEFRDYNCRFCDNQYPTRALLRDHLDDAHNRHLCQVCGKKFLHGYLLDRHYATYHKELGITAPAIKDMALYECEVCHNKFRSRPALADHMRVHTGEKPFKCKVCGKGFKQKAHLTIHQIQHTGERPNKCHICGKSFTFKWTLESHVRIHTGEKPFSCSYCNNCYRDSTLLLKHKKKDHSDKVIITKRGKIAKPKNSAVNSIENGISTILPTNIEHCTSNNINSGVSNNIVNRRMPESENVSQQSASNNNFNLPLNLTD